MSLYTAPLPEVELRRRARYFRNILVPAVACHGDRALTQVTITDVTIFLVHLDKTPITADTLRRTRIEKALLEVCAQSALWPPSLFEMAQQILRKWERKLGDLSGLRSSLFEAGGRMAGCRKETSALGDIDSPTSHRVGSTRWIVETSDQSHVDSHGSGKFEIGDWWINTAAAYRDGILDDPNCDITADYYGAFAIVLANGDEKETSEPGVTRLQVTNRAIKMSKRGAGVVSLVGNMHNHKDVRILRGWKLHSPLAPKGGIRYDGIYSVTGMGLTRPHKEYVYSFELRRHADQANIRKALMRPNTEEYDDWLDYLDSKSSSKDPDTVGRARTDGAETTPELESPETESNGDVSEGEDYNTPVREAEAQLWAEEEEKERWETGLSRFHLAPQGTRRGIAQSDVRSPGHIAAVPKYDEPIHERQWRRQ